MTATADPAARVIVQYRTTFSVYEVDHTGPGFRVRKVSGDLPSTARQADLGVWQDALDVEVDPAHRLVFTWGVPDDGKVLQQTITSPVLEATPLPPEACSG